MIRSRIGWSAVLVLAVAVGLGCEDNPADVKGSGREFSAMETADFAVTDSSSAIVQTFVGTIAVRPAAEGNVRVVTTRWADREDDLASLSVEASLQDNTLELAATNPSDLRDVSVDFELTGPPDMSVDAQAGVGTISCRGRPPELWNLGVGVGNIELVIPSDANVRVDLVTGVGSVDVGLAVQGSVTDESVVGTIGTGADGEIIARCGVGSISLSASR